MTESAHEDREFVLAAVRQTGYALNYAEDSLKADREVVLAAVQENVYNLAYVALDLKADREFVKELLASGGASDSSAWHYFSRDIRRDKETIIFELNSAGIKG